MPAPLNHNIIETKTAKILLKQHIGVDATPIVNMGDTVSKGTLIATCYDKLGANIHASINGNITKITKEFIEIKA